MNELATTLSIISLIISLGVGIWTIWFNWKNREIKKEVKRHAEILRNSKP